MADIVGGGGWEGIQDPMNNPAARPRAQPLNPADLASLQPWQDAAYQQATRALDPQFQAAEARFNQDMVNRGIAQGSDAYTAARSDFDRGRNDAYGSARNQALAQALAAQGQGFGQQYGLDQLNTQARSASAQAGALRNQTAQDMEFRNRAFGEDTRRWDLGRGDQLGQQDFNNMMGLMDFDRGTNAMNNGFGQMDFQNNMGLMGFTPNSNPYMVDTNSPYQIQGQNEANRSQAAGQQANSTMSTIGQIAGAVLPLMMMCDRNVKDTLGPASPAECLDALCAVPLDRWAYQADGVMHIGTYAQDFHSALGLEPNNRIWVGDFLGALLGAVKALKTENDDLRERLDSLAPKRRKAA